MINKSLREFSDAELKAELDRRDSINNSRPRPRTLPDCNWDEVYRAVEQRTNELTVTKERTNELTVTTDKDLYWRSKWDMKIAGLALQAVYADMFGYYKWERRALSGC